MEKPNLEYINQLSGDNEEFKLKVITILKSELPQEIEMYQNQINSKNFKLAAESVHKLKHKISILGLDKNYLIASEYEDNLKDQSIKLQSEFEAILQVMQDFVNKL